MRHYMRAANVKWVGLDLSDVKQMDFTPEEFEVYRLRYGDLIVGEASGSRTEVGKSAVWGEEVPGACFQNTLIRVRLREGSIPEYVQKHLLHDALRGALANISKGVGIFHLSSRVFSQWKIRLPPLNEQRRIVAKIEELTARNRRAREALEAIPPLLERLRQSILAAAFRGDLTADWRAQHPDVEPASELLKRIRVERRRRWEEAELAKMRAKGKDPKNDRWRERYKEPELVDPSGLPELPEGWCWTSGETIAWETTVGHVGPMKKRYAGAGVPFLRSQNVRPNRIDLGGLKYIPIGFHGELAKSRLAPGDLVIVRTGDPGTAAVIPGDIPEANCADLVISRIVKPAEAALVAYFMNSSFAKAQVTKRQVGVAQQHFNVQAMKSFPIPMLPVSESAEVQRRIGHALEWIDRAVATHLPIRDRLDRLNQSILAKAFRGELVPQNPDDEPATVLLSRIQADCETSTPRGRKQ